MDAVGNVLNTAVKTTHTKTSHQQNSDGRANGLEFFKNMGILQFITEAPPGSDEPYKLCGECNTPIERDVDFMGVVKRMPAGCECHAEKARVEKEREERVELQRRLDRYKRYSLMDERFSESTFDKWVMRDDNRTLYVLGKSYCENWNEMYTKNHGMLIHGKAGNGKTYLSFAIANELYRLGITVLAISVSRILKILQDNYNNKNKIGEMDVLNTLNDARLLILDDLGVEHKTNWSYEKLYSIIDTRYRARKPLIITTNLTLDGLRDNLSIIDSKSGTHDNSDRIYNRIIEMCAFIETTGESWRIQKGEENRKALFDELGIIRNTK
jgi:DNA replication protein DnaC